MNKQRTPQGDLSDKYVIGFRTPVKVVGRSLALDKAVGPKGVFATFEEARYFVETHMAQARKAGACRAVVTRGAEEFAEYFDSMWFVYGDR
ncbi:MULTISPECIES: hypothetical protein [unclassified Paludibacterium]|uniref:hypothetical protein n=1 Tax=unclassified Paludibacterium TaxID=2618429 RepID=UPI001C03AD46|nr:hypothetical protein [Paludibacterium sp. B53371]